MNGRPGEQVNRNPLVSKSAVDRRLL